jgi:UTP--glucose-1-phosphate uridylyltransferase
VFVTLDAKERGAGNEIQLTDALAKQIGRGKFSGLRFSGERFDCGSKLGFLQANLAFAMENDALAPALQAWIRDRIK